MDYLSWNLDQEATRQPRFYKLRVLLLALSGNVFIGLMFALVLEIVVGIPWLVLTHTTNHLWTVGLLFLVTAVLIWPLFGVQSSRIQGVILDRRQAPQLFALLDELSVAFRIQKLRRVILTPDFKLTLHRSFRWFVGGYSKVDLVLGLSVMQALTPEELRALLAHELAHLCPKQHHLASWLRCLCQSWQQVAEALSRQRGGVAKFLLGRFVNWYLPRLKAYSWPILKQDEFVVDRRVVYLTGSEMLVQTLVSLAIKERILAEEFWPMLYSHAYHHAEPPTDLFEQLARTLKLPVQADTAHYYLQKALKTRVNSSDPRPCLHDRLLALGQLSEALPLPVKPLRVNAAQTFLNKALPELMRQFNQDWQTSVRFHWKELHASAQARPKVLSNRSQKSTAF